MSRRGQDIALGASLGAMVGAIPAMLAAGAYVTWRYGGSLRELDMWTYARALPGLQAALVPGDFRAGALIGLGVLAGAAIGGVCLLWRSELSSHGTARWAEPSELKRARLLARSAKSVRGPIWGKLGGPRSSRAYISSEKIVHSLIAAPTGAGKGVGVVIPTLLTYPGSVVVLDVKGENYAETARRRHRMKDRVFKFSPSAEDGKSHRYNPLDIVAATPERRRFGAALDVANALLVPRHGIESWIGGSREILAAAIITAIEHGRGTMAAVYDLMSIPAERTNELLGKLAAMTTSGEAKSVFARYAGMDQKAVTSYLSILQEGGLRIWADADVRDATAATEFEITSFRSDPAALYLCVTQTDIEKLAPLLRLILQQMFTLLQETRRGPRDRFDVLFVLDEFASLGRMDELSRAITTLRASGTHLMLIVQSLANLSGPYGKEGAANFMGNCELQLYMAPTDIETPRFISEAIGSRTIRKRARTRDQTGFEGAQITESEAAAPLIRPEQIRLVGDEAVIALVRDVPPVLARRVIWFRDPALRRLHKAQSSIAFETIEPKEMPETPRSGQLWRDAAKAAAAGARKEPTVAGPSITSHARDDEPPNQLPDTGAAAPSTPRLIRGTSDPEPTRREGESLDQVLSEQARIKGQISKYAAAREKLHKRSAP